MQWGLLIPIVAIASGPVAWMVTTWLRTRHGYPIESRDGTLLTRDGLLGSAREIELLSGENERLRGQISRLEERIAVLERIATDQPSRLGREIEALR